MKHLRGNTVVSVDVETTGTQPGFHEIVQIAVVPLKDFEPCGEPFYTNIQPSFPHRADPASIAIHGLTPEVLEDAPDQMRASDLFAEWASQYSGKLIPLAHSYTFEYGFLKAWLGSQFSSTFHYHPRDAMGLALALNDLAAIAGREPPFPSVSLANLCKQFGIENQKAHDAFSDAIAEAKLYKKMLCTLA
jgi:DNA polymerase-3 subunit epsilon